jgi:hypothetical protein
MKERKFDIVLTGIRPLLMHYDNIEWADRISVARDQIRRDNKANFSAGDDRCPPDTWKGYMYNDVAGQYVTLPTDNLRTCLTKAGAMITLQKQTTFKRLVASGILFEDVDTQFGYGPKGVSLAMADVNKIAGDFNTQLAAVRKMGFDLMTKRAAVGASKHVRVRPIFRQWTVRTSIIVVDDQITNAALDEMWRLAGLRIGLGDWRPSSPKSPGPYGMFTVTVK